MVPKHSMAETWITFCRKYFFNSKKKLYQFQIKSYNGTEICELVGIFILKLLEDKIDKQGIGLYRDNGLK